MRNLSLLVALGALACSSQQTAAGVGGAGGDDSSSQTTGAGTGGHGGTSTVASTSETASSTSVASSASSTAASSATSASSVASSSASSSVASSSVAQSSAASAASSVASSSAVASSSVASSSSSGGNPNQIPCTNGPGWVAFRFHYTPNGGEQAYLDAFGLPDNSNWEAVPAFSTSVQDAGNGGGLEIGGGNWILIRYSLVGLTQINSASFSVYGRSYNVSASGSFDAWSPIYGDDASPTNSVSNAWPYAWTTVDYSTQLAIGDPPGLTGIRLYSGPNSDDLVIHAVELCIDGF